MKRNFLSGPVIGFWGGGVLFSLLLILISGGSAGSIFSRLFLNILLVTLFVGCGWILWTRFLKETVSEQTSKPDNDEEDEILLESEPNQLYTETERSDISDGPVANGKTGDLFSKYKYDSDSEAESLRHLDSRNPYEMSDSLLRKFKTEEEDSLAKFKAAFQSPEEIAKAVRTELHKDD